MFKKRSLPSVLGGFNQPNVLFLKSDSDGKRTLVRSSVNDFRSFNPIDFVDFSLSEELSAGVPLKEVNTTVLDSRPEMSQEQILETLENQNTKTD